MFTAKFQVGKVIHHGNDCIEPMMHAVMDEQTSFTKYTPSGSITFVCTNPEVNKQVEPGKKYLVTFQEVTE